MILSFYSQRLKFVNSWMKRLTAKNLQSLKVEVQQWIDGLVREFKIDYDDEDWAEARDTVRKLRFFQKVMNDLDKAEDQLLDDDSFDLDDEF